MTHSYVQTKTPLRDPPEEASGPGYIWWVCSSGFVGGQRLKCGWVTCKRSVPMERRLLRRVSCLQTTLHFHWAPLYLSGMCECKQHWNSKWSVITPNYFVLFCMQWCSIYVIVLLSRIFTLSLLSCAVDLKINKYKKQTILLKQWHLCSFLIISMHYVDTGDLLINGKGTLVHVYVTCHSRTSRGWLHATSISRCATSTIHNLKAIRKCCLR